MAFLALPAALAGGVLGALALGSSITLGALIGLMALLGLAARQALVLVRHLQRLEQVDELAFDEDLVRRGAGERLAPVLASSLAVGAVMAPFAVLGSMAGLEIVHPMAVVLLCGLVTSTALTLLALPALYLHYETGRPRPLLEPAAQESDDARVLAFEFDGEPAAKTPA